MKYYRILASHKEDINSPSIWVQDKNIKHRNLAKIKNECGKSVWVEIQIIDPNFRNLYNSNPYTLNIEEGENIIVINEWYRDKLEIETKKSYKLRIYPSKFSLLYPFRQMQAALQHPDSSVKICVDLAIVSVALGFLGFVLGIISLIK